MGNEIGEKLTSLVGELFQKAGFNLSSITLDKLTSLPEEDSRSEVPEEVFMIKLTSDEDCAMFLGKFGENLKAFEHVCRSIAAKSIGQKVFFSIDINGYREQRSKRIVEIAKQVAERVKATQKAEVLFPMTAYERRLVHVELVSEKEIFTESIGEEPRRRVVVRPVMSF